MRKTERIWLLAVVSLTPFTPYVFGHLPDPLDLIAVNTDTIKNFTAAQPSDLNQGTALSAAPCYKGVQWKCHQKPSC